jgi:hypothetical protein
MGKRTSHAKRAPNFADSIYYAPRSMTVLSLDADEVAHNHNMRVNECLGARCLLMLTATYWIVSV